MLDLGRKDFENLKAINRSIIYSYLLRIVINTLTLYTVVLDDVIPFFSNTVFISTCENNFKAEEKYDTMDVISSSPAIAHVPCLHHS